MKTIAIARLRSRVNYKEPLDHLMDSFYYCLRIFREKHPQFKYTYYNFGFDQTPTRDVDAIKNADVILIPTENEFHAWVPNYLHRLDLEKCNQKIELIKPHINNKKVILLSNDRADNPDLYKKYTLADCKCDIDILDEDDFPKGIHVLKYYFLREAIGKPGVLRSTQSFDTLETPKEYDFCYWGTDKRKLPGGEKSGDVRNDILKVVRKQSDISSMYVGRFYNIQRDSGMLPLRELFPIMMRSRTTLCFNWMSDTALTARYHEAMAAKIMTPLVWKQYDITGRLGIEDWQRCHSAEDVVEKIKWCAKNPKTQETLHKKYEESLPSKEEIYNLFEKLLLSKI